MQRLEIELSKSTGNSKFDNFCKDFEMPRPVYNTYSDSNGPEVEGEDGEASEVDIPSKKLGSTRYDILIIFHYSELFSDYSDYHSDIILNVVKIIFTITITIIFVLLFH